MAMMLPKHTPKHAPGSGTLMSRCGEVRVRIRARARARLGPEQELGLEQRLGFSYTVVVQHMVEGPREHHQHHSLGVRARVTASGRGLGNTHHEAAQCAWQPEGQVHRALHAMGGPESSPVSGGVPTMASV